MSHTSEFLILRFFASKAAREAAEARHDRAMTEVDRASAQVVETKAAEAAATKALNPILTQTMKRYLLPVDYDATAAPEEECCSFCESQDQAKFEALTVFERGMQEGPAVLNPPYLCPMHGTMRCPRRPLPAT